MDAGPTIHPAPGETERAHLAQAHHELCTALTIMRSNVELVRIELRGPGRPARETDPHIVVHLEEVDTALTRLERLAMEFRAWHAHSRRAASQAHGDTDAPGQRRQA